MEKFVAPNQPVIDRVADVSDRFLEVLDKRPTPHGIAIAALLSTAVAIIQSNPHAHPPEIDALLSICRLVVGQVLETAH